MATAVADEAGECELVKTNETSAEQTSRSFAPLACVVAGAFTLQVRQAKFPLSP